jgi:hypothetical protein
MLRRFLFTSLMSFGIGIWLFSAGSTSTPLQADEPGAGQGQAAIEAQPLADLTSLKNQGIEVLDKGPVHEAFAQPTNKNPEPGPIIHKQPPKAIEELPPEQKPEGDNVQWIKGYWAWDADRNDFIWVSGLWRVAPPDRNWVAGSWTQVDGGWQWVPGYWGAVGQENGQAYLPQPPDSLDYGPTVPAPSEDAFYVPGNWVYTNHYLWQPGYWSYYRPGFIWNPACYYWTPYGYTYCGGYWDYPWWNRGWLFAPVWFNRPIFWNTGFFFRPFFAINTPFLSTFFFFPHSHHFFFGHSGDPFFHQHGFQVASFNRVNNSVNISNINNINSNNINNVVNNRARTGPVVTPVTRVATNTRLGAGVTSSSGVTRLNSATGRPTVAANGSGIRTPPTALSRTTVNSSERMNPNHGSISPRVTSPARGSATLSSPGRPATHGNSTPVIRSTPSAPHGNTSHGSHYSAPATRSAPTAPHASAPHVSYYSPPAHISGPAFHNPAPAHFSGMHSVGGTHSGGGGHVGGGGGHVGGAAHSGGGHPSNGGGHGHR